MKHNFKGFNFVPPVLLLERESKAAIWGDLLHLLVPGAERGECSPKFY